MTSWTYSIRETRPVSVEIFTSTEEYTWNIYASTYQQAGFLTNNYIVTNQKGEFYTRVDYNLHQKQNIAKVKLGKEF